MMTHVWGHCSDAYNYSIRKYIHSSVTITIGTKDEVNTYTCNGYYLYANVTISCANNIITVPSTMPTITPTYEVISILYLIELIEYDCNLSHALAALNCMCVFVCRLQLQNHFFVEILFVRIWIFSLFSFLFCIF